MKLIKKVKYILELEQDQFESILRPIDLEWIGEQVTTYLKDSIEYNEPLYTCNGNCVGSIKKELSDELV